MIKVTIDTNLINARQRLLRMSQLEKWALEGKIIILGSQRLFDELNSPERIEKGEKIRNIFEPFTIGKSAIGIGYIASPEKAKFKELASILFPDIDPLDLNENQSNDVMHLLGHHHGDSDIFLTENTKDFIHGNKTNQNRHLNLDNTKKIELKERFNIVVMTSQECVDCLHKKYLFELE